MDLHLLDANAECLAGDQAFNFVGTSAFSGVAGELHYAPLGANTLVSGDVNGDKVGDFSILPEWISHLKRCLILYFDFCRKHEGSGVDDSAASASRSNLGSGNPVAVGSVPGTAQTPWRCGCMAPMSAWLAPAALIRSKLCVAVPRWPPAVARGAYPVREPAEAALYDLAAGRCQG